MFERDDGVVERQLECAHLGCGGGVVALGGWGVAGEAGAEALGGRSEERRLQADGQLLGYGE